MKYLSPKLDIVFKKMFGDVNNSDMLRDLVKAYLGVDATGKFELSNTEITPVELDRKFARLDLKISTRTEVIDIEVQIANQPDYNDRSIYYWAALYASTVGKGDEYNNSKTTLSLNILDFKMFDCDDFNTNFTFYDPKNGLSLSDKARISFIELPKVREITPEQIKSDERIAWAAFFNASREEDFDMLDRITENPNVQKAVTIIRELSADEKVQEEARKREEALLNERWALSAAKRDALAEGRAEGKAEGIAEGKAEGLSMMANALRAMGMDERDIEEAVLRAQGIEPERDAVDENEGNEEWES